ncbi:MAG: hypothetical protein LQ338_000238 [Usnochroma carphineum]|nr:MAG: hypothetical protein LQ338_000238 [Usnochroma carphineum]
MDSTSTADTSPSHQESAWTTATHHAEGYDANVLSSPTITAIDPKRSPSALALRAFLLGLAFGVSLTFSLFLLQPPQNPLWRASCFLGTLSAFHFLEYYITALYNPPAATISAFLLTGNGYAYNIAHTLALVECVFRNYAAPIYYPEVKYLQPCDALLPAGERGRAIWLMVGFAMLLVGQATRTLAMIHAGTNFNHLVQFRKKAGHVLVTHGIYRWLRHPSYFGFFWWGLGTQVIMGNMICLIGYALVLWRFFSNRIESE